MRTTLAALAGASVAFASVTPDSYGSDDSWSPPAYGGNDGPSSEAAVSSSAPAKTSSYASGTSSSIADAASSTPDFPSCWSSCFTENKVSSPEETCGNDDVTECIEESCSEEEADKYNEWLAEECGAASTSSNVAGPTGSISLSHGPSGYPTTSSLAGPHTESSSYPVDGPSKSYPGVSSGYVPSSSGYPGGYGNCTTTYSSVCTETETLIYRDTTEYAPTTITHIFTTNLPSGSCSGVPYPITSSSSVPYSPETTSDVPSGPTGGYGSDVPSGPTGGYGQDSSSPVSPEQPTSYPSHDVETAITTVYTTVCPATQTTESDGQTITSVYETTSAVTEVITTTVNVPAPSDSPSCWDSCFIDNGVSAKEDACKPEVGKCISDKCTAEESSEFDAWAVGFCVSETSDVPVVPAETSTPVSPEQPETTPAEPTPTGSTSCSDSCYSENGVTSKEGACKPEVGKCIKDNCSAEESSSFDAWATSFCVEGGNDNELPTEPAGGNGGVPAEYTSVHPVTKPFTYGDWTSYYTDFETVTMTSYVTETAAVPTGGYGSPDTPTEGSPEGPDGPTEGSPEGPAVTPTGGYGGHETTATQEYHTTKPTTYTTVCPAEDGDSITTSTITTTSTIDLTFTVTTTDYPETTSSSVGGPESQAPYPTGSESSKPAHPTGGYGTGSSSYPVGPTGGSKTSSYPVPTGSDTPSNPIPDCWAKCFAENDIDSEAALCGDIGVETCIKAECPVDSYNAYEGWLDAYCGKPSTSSGVVGPTGGSTSSGYAHPTGGSSGYPHPTGSGSQPSGTSSPSGTISTSSTCSLPTPTKECKKCDGQPGNDKYCGLDINTNIYKDGNAPITCETVEYDWEITTGNVSPDGVERWAILVNGQSPGPKIEANWGDEIVVRVKNSMPASDLNGTTIHWHGIHQKGTPEYDGVPSLTQCPIAPGESFVYKFRATQYGSTWYHSHFALQAYDGLFGPMIIHGPVQEGYEYDGEEFISLQDWRHEPLNYVYHQLELVSNGQRSSPTLDNGLINGMNTFNGGGERWQMNVEKGKTYRLRVLNAAIQSTFKFYIDGHSFKVIAADLVPIEPYETNIININNGQRYDVIFTADQPSANYWMRSDVQAPCSNVTNGLDVKAIVHYADADDSEPASQAYQYQPECIDEPMENLVPILPWNAGASADEIDKDVLIVPNGGNPNLFKWTLSGTAFFSQWGDPTLQSIYDDGTVPTYSGDLAIREDNLGEWIYVIIDSVIPLPHPIHLHGHDFLVLDQGVGPYNPATASLNLQNPPRRDTAIMPFQLGPGAVGGYLVVAFYTDNPGVWLMHCHIGWHNAMGFALQIIEGLEDIKETVEFKCQMDDTCDAWHAYAQEYGIEVSDSGI